MRYCIMQSVTTDGVTTFRFMDKFHGKKSTWAKNKGERKHGYPSQFTANKVLKKLQEAGLNNLEVVTLDKAVAKMGTKVVEKKATTTASTTATSAATTTSATATDATANATATTTTTTATK